MESEELLRLAVQTRQFEIQMFWQRSNYFMVLNTAIAVGFFSITFTGANLYAAALALLGFAACIAWFCTALGSKYWQCRWEEATARLEKKCDPDACLFDAEQKEIEKEVQQNLDKSQHWWPKRQVDKLILQKPSVSFQMLWLSASFIMFWLVVSFASFLSWVIA